MAYQITSHSVNKVSPFKLLYGRQAALPGYLARLSLPLSIDYHTNLLGLTQTIMSLQDQAFQNLASSCINSFVWDQDKLPPFQSFQIGDKVLMFRERLGQKPNKLQSLWIDPCEVIGQVGQEVYTLKDLLYWHIINRVHAKYLKLAPDSEDKS